MTRAKLKDEWSKNRSTKEYYTLFGSTLRVSRFDSLDGCVAEEAELLSETSGLNSFPSDWNTNKTISLERSNWMFETI